MRSWLADDVVFDAPAGRLDGPDALLGFMAPFAATLTGVSMIAALGTDDEALLMYDCATAAVPSAPAAEWYRVADGRVVAGRIIFDRLPFALARGEVSRAG